MPRIHRQRQNRSYAQNNNTNTNNNNQSQGRRFPEQDVANSIPFYNARLFSMYESLIQSYTHFTYHANHMYNVLEQALHGTRNTINSNPYPWLLIPHPQQQPQTQPQQQPQQQPQPQPQQQAPRREPRREPPYQAPRDLPRDPPQSRTMPSMNSTNRTTRAPPPSRSPETNIINALFGIINPPPEERRLTLAQLDERVETITFGNIVNPINNVCSITQDAFEQTQQVARIRHCGHIFNSDSLAQWLRMNNTCPTCRHNLLTDPAPTSSIRRVQFPLESEININTFYNELLRNSGNIPGFELNSINDDSVVFSFDLMNRSASGTSGTGASGTGAPGVRGPGRIDDVD